MGARPTDQGTVNRPASQLIRGETKITKSNEKAKKKAEKIERQTMNILGQTKNNWGQIWISNFLLDYAASYSPVAE